MRAKEFTNFNFDIEPYEAWSGEGVIVHAYDGKEEIGHVIFEPTDHDVTQWYAVDVEVEEPYQRRGIATKMYDIAKQAAKSAGAIIVKSHAQTDAGRGLWGDKKVWEEVNPEVMDTRFHHEVEMHGYRYVADTESNKFYGSILHITVFDGDEKIAQTSFKVDGDSLTAGSTVVWPKYRRQNIATNMYAYAKMLGNDITPSTCQLDAGERMWRSWNQSGQSKHILPKGHKGYN